MDFLPTGEITGLIGTNEAGKSTLFNTVLGFYRSDGGNMLLDEGVASATPSHDLFRPGSTECFDVVDRLLGFRTVLIVGIDIHRANDAFGVDDKPPRHRQGPTAFAVS